MVNEEEEEGAHSIIDDMNPYTYFIATSLLIIGLVIAAIFVKDPSIVFDGMTGVVCMTLSFIIPGLAFLIAHN